MTMLKRLSLFLLVNMMVVTTLSLVMNLLGIQRYTAAYGFNSGSLMVYCLVWGMGGALISLAMSRVMAKSMLGVQVVNAETRDPLATGLHRKVQQLAERAGLPMPEVGIYDSPEVNAFATGPTRSRALVAVSTGLLQRMNDAELEGVLGHELAHVANGDMVTMTLLQGVTNAFAMFLSRAIAFLVAQSMRSDDERDRGSPMLVYGIQMLLEIVFMILGSLVVAWFSRYREYRADAGGAILAGRPSMVGALQALQRTVQIEDPAQAQGVVQTLKISGHPHGLMALFASHPPLEARIARLNQSSV